MSRLHVLLFCFLWLLPAVLVGQETQTATDPATLIRTIGLEESQVMETAWWLTEVYGPRLTGSPELDRAAAWAMDQMKAWGLENVHKEMWGPFGRGWSLEHVAMTVTSPTTFPVIAYPKAWSPSIEGPVEAEVVYLDATTDEEFAKYRGTLAGKIVLLEDARPVPQHFEPLARRRDAENLLQLANLADPDYQPYRYSQAALEALRIRMKRLRFLYEEKPLAILDRYRKGDGGTVFVSSATVPGPEGTSWRELPHPWDPDVEVIPQLTVAVEHYNRIFRLLQHGFPVRISLDLRTKYHGTNEMAYNILAEIPGTDPQLKDEVVMLGAHFDSWHAGTGATDNAAGSAVVMEAARILKEYFRRTGEQPRRTIRVALWTGEEQGLYGSVAYVNQHFAEIEGWNGPVKRLKPEHVRLAAYYNLDNGTGKIRGVYLQGNEAVAPIFRRWLKPFHDLGAATLTIANTGGTDHLPFDGAGLPGFQFIQDPIAYSTRTHHSNMDVYDNLVADDLKQAATIMAYFVYRTAQRDEKLPRKPVKMASASDASH